MKMGTRVNLQPGTAQGKQGEEDNGKGKNTATTGTGVVPGPGQPQAEVTRIVVGRPAMDEAS